MNRMNEIVKGHILNRVHQHYQYLIDTLKYDSDRILGVFAYGSMNYGTYSYPTSDVDTKAIYVPTFDELIFNRPISKEYQLENGEHIEVKDIREMVNMWRKQNINFLEILFTDYHYINPKYQTLWDTEFIRNREDIAAYDPDATFLSICGQAKHTLEQIKGWDGKKVSNAIRLAHFLMRYDTTLPYRDCFDFGKPSPTDLDAGLRNNTEVRDIIMELKYRENEPWDWDEHSIDDLVEFFDDIQKNHIRKTERSVKYKTDLTLKRITKDTIIRGMQIEFDN